MITLNQKGQGFEVFKLLIAAIVAVFILTILLQILSGIVPPTQGDPTQEASSKIKSLVSSPYTPQNTGAVLFKKDNAIVNATTIARQTGSLSGAQICIDVSSDIEGTELFERSSDGRILTYTGTTDYRAKLKVICGAGGSGPDTIDGTISTLNLGDVFPNCAGVTGSSSQTYCYVSVVSTE